MHASGLINLSSIKAQVVKDAGSVIKPAEKDATSTAKSNGETFHQEPRNTHLWAGRLGSRKLKEE